MDNQQFVLRWHYQQTTLTNSLPNLLESNLLTDVTLSADNQHLRAHKLVLATCSSYFLQLFKDMGPIIHPVIILHNVPYDDLKAIISFIYKGQCLVTKQQIPSLLSCAKLLKIQGLCDIKLEDYLSPKESYCPIVQNDSYLKQKDETLDDDSKSNTDTNGHVEEEKATPDCFLTPEPRDEVGQGLMLNLYKKMSSKEAAETCKCFICGKYLSNQYNLRVHMETHEETYHACQSCPHISRSRDALRKHVSYRHPEEYSIRKRKRNDH